MSKLSSYEMLLEMKNPEFQNVLSPGALVAIFNHARGDDVIIDDDPMKRILKAIWLVANCFPQYSVTMSDFAKAIFVDQSKVQAIINRDFLEANSKLVEEARNEIESCLKEALIPFNPIKREGFVSLDLVDKVLTTFLDVLNADQWTYLDWPMVVRDDETTHRLS